MASLWDQIQEKKKKVDEMEQKRVKMRADFMADDGEIDEEEEMQLAQIRGGISVAKRKVEELIAEFEKNKKMWQSHAGELAEIKKQIKDLAEWEDPVCSQIDSVMKEVDSCESAQNYKDATAQLKAAMTSIKGPYAEYKRQKPERDLFEKERPDFEARLSKLKTTKYQTPSFDSAIAGLDTGFPDVCSKADGRDFIAARQGLATLMGSVEEEEEEALQLEQKEKEAQELLKTVKDKLASTGEAAYKSVEDAAKSVADGVSDAEAKCGTFDFDNAIEKIKKVGSDVDAYVKRVAELAAEKAEWDGVQPTYDTVKKQIKELQDWGEKAVDSVRKVADDAQTKSNEESWKDASTMVGTGLSEIGPMVENMTKQKAAQATYTGLRAALDARLTVVRSSKYQTEIVTAVLAQIDTNLGAIQSHVDAKEFVEAVELVNSASEELLKAEAEIAKCMIDETDAKALLDAVKNRVSAVGENVFEQLKETAQAVKNGVTEAESTIDGLDYETAIQMLRELATEAEDYATRVRELVEEKAKWDNAQPVYDKVKQQIDELKEWGEKGVDKIKEVADGAQKTAEEEKWADAAGEVDTCNMDIGPMVDEMTKQKAAQATYQGLRAAFQVRLNLVRASKYQTDTVVAVLAQIDANTGAMEAHAEAKDFVEAMALLTAASSELVVAEAEIARLTQAEETAKAMLRDLMNKVGTLPTTAFRELADATREVMATVAEIQTQVAQGLVDEAIAGMKGIAGAVENLITRSAAKLAEKAEWDAAKPAYDTVRKQIKELQDWGEKAVDNVRKIADDALKNAEEESWKDAAEKVKIGMLDIGPMVDEMARQKAAEAAYTGLRAAFDARLTMVRSSKYQTEIVTAVLAQIDTNLPAIDAHVETRDFTEALDLLNAASAELLNAETEIAEAALKETDAKALLDAVKNRVASFGETVFESVKDTAKAVKDGMDTAERTIDGLDYDTAIETLKGLATQAEEYANRVRELAAEKAKWDAAKPAHDVVMEQIEELKNWGEKGVEKIREVADEALSNAEEEKWADAAEKVGTSKTDISPMMEEMARQKAAEAVYTAQRAALDAQIKIIRQSPYQSEIIVAMLAQVDTNIGAIDSHVEEKDFVGALDLVNAMMSELAEAESELERLAEAEKAFHDKFDQLTKDFMEIQGNDFADNPEVKSLMDAFQDDQNAGSNSANAHQFDEGMDRLGACEQQHLPALKNKITELEEERQRKQDEFINEFNRQLQMSSTYQNSKFKDDKDIKTLMAAFQKDHGASTGSADQKDFDAAMGLLETCETTHLAALAEKLTALEEEEEAILAFAEEEEEMMQAFTNVEKEIDDVLKELQSV